MANLPKEKIKVKDVIYPLNAQQVFIGLELDESDQRLMEYFNYIDKFVKAEKITCVHVVPEVTSVFPFQGLFAEGAKTTNGAASDLTNATAAPTSSDSATTFSVLPSWETLDRDLFAVFLFPFVALGFVLMALQEALFRAVRGSLGWTAAAAAPR